MKLKIKVFDGQWHALFPFGWWPVGYVRMISLSEAINRGRKDLDFYSANGQQQEQPAA